MLLRGDSGACAWTGSSTATGISSIGASTTALFAAQPSSIILTANLGAGSAKNPLDNKVEAVLVDADGNEIAATKVTVATSLPKDPADIEVTIPYAANAYGLKLMHVKENSWNARYYSFTLAYAA